MVGGPPGKVQSLYNTPCYIMDLDITGHGVAPKFILPRNFLKEL